MQNIFTDKTRLPIHNKLLGFTVLIGLVSIAFLGFFYHSFSSSLEAEKKAESKHLSEVGLGVIEHFHQLAESGTLTSAEAKEQAISTLTSLSYGENGYFWINSGDGILLMQPHTPAKIGSNLSDWTDIKGKYIFREFNKKAKAGGGWLTYHWVKPNSQRQSPKVSYVSYFPPWNWVLGNGLYLDDMRKNITWSVIQASGILLVSFILFIATALFILNFFLHQLGELAVKDTLTNLYTRRFLTDILPDILNKEPRYNRGFIAVIFLDVDHFKKVNDNYGHELGDIVLKNVADVILSNTRSENYAIRFGGEEFVLVGFFDNQRAAMQAAERIRKQTALLSFDSNDGQFNITISAGIATYNAEDKSLEDVLKRADEKLFESKNSGRNKVSI